ncbi:hypothetical protein GQ53DRAFT_638100, partial [Thozetella sp. PMI_491]
MLGSESFQHAPASAKCVQWRNISYLLYVRLVDDVPAFPQFSTFHTVIRASGLSPEDQVCVEANITPELSPAVQSTLRYGPLVIFLVVLLSGLLRSAFDVPPLVEIDGTMHPLPRAVLPHVGECLQYLQFMFLTGGLTLFYPGFYQPAVSHLNWFSLLTGGFINHGWSYLGSSDGIYEVNGTYGGTFGMEVMSQIVGAPSAKDVWLNMVVMIGIIATLAFICLKVIEHFNIRRDAQPPPASGFRQMLGQVLRVVISYFALPLVALSSYQLINVANMPAYHIAFAVILIAAILAALVWLLHQVPVRSAGLLIFNSNKRYRQLSSSEASYRQDSSFVLLLFVLLFISGASIGGLQISGLVQLAVLGGCEVVLLAAIAGFRAYSTFSIGTIASATRLSSLIAMVAFLPATTSDATRSAVGYMVLILHSSVLIFCFLFPALYHLGKLAMPCLWPRTSPDVYGLRELRRREGHRTNM